jgi:hypothetical protein
MSMSESRLREIIHQESARSAPIAPTESHSDHVCGCKDCFCDTVKKLDRDAKYECETCHLPLPDSMVGSRSDLDPQSNARADISCPLCGGKSAQKRTNTPLKR